MNMQIRGLEVETTLAVL